MKRTINYKYARLARRKRNDQTQEIFQSKENTSNCLATQEKPKELEDQKKKTQPNKQTNRTKTKTKTLKKKTTTKKTKNKTTKPPAKMDA